MTTLTPNEKKGLWLIGIPALPTTVFFILLAESGEAGMFFALPFVISLVILLICLIIAAHYIHKDKALFHSNILNNPIYSNLTSKQVAFIEKSFWGPFFHPICWGVGNRLYLLGLEGIIPVWGTIIWLRLIFRGGMISWEQGGWKNFEEFKQRQQNLAWITPAVLILSLLIEEGGLLALAMLAVIAYKGLYDNKQKPLTSPGAPLIPPTASL